MKIGLVYVSYKHAFLMIEHEAKPTGEAGEAECQL